MVWEESLTVKSRDFRWLVLMLLLLCKKSWLAVAMRFMVAAATWARSLGGSFWRLLATARQLCLFNFVPREMKSDSSPQY